MVKPTKEEIMATAKQKKQKAISKKISVLRHEGVPQDQAVAQAHSMVGANKQKKKKKS